MRNFFDDMEPGHKVACLFFGCVVLVVITIALCVTFCQCGPGRQDPVEVKTK